MTADQSHPLVLYLNELFFNRYVTVHEEIDCDITTILLSFLQSELYSLLASSIGK
jgi:hypothetical protein